jgi:hypothetical protein
MLELKSHMAWIEKEHTFALENKPIEGLFFIDGDIAARRIPNAGTEGMKYPTIVFPSGVVCDLWESSDPNNAIVHISGEMDLPLHDNRDNALKHAQNIAEQVGYLVRSSGEQGIDVFGTDEEHIRILYDNNVQRMIDVHLLHDEAGEHPKQELLDTKTREALPPLRSQEHLGLDALAHAKFFTPDSSWTWYASEFDGEDIFFGLVDGFELEFGSFTLSELLEVRGGLSLPVERDRYFQPTTFKELLAMHEKRRTTQSQPPKADKADIVQTERDEAERLIMLKDDILQRFQELPPDHQTSIGLVLVKHMMQGEWGERFVKALNRIYLPLGPFPTVDRSEIALANFSQEEIDQLSDADVTTIARRMRDHYVTDLFWDELRFHTEETLQSKSTGQPIEPSEIGTGELPSFPTNSVAREDLLYCRPDFKREIEALSDTEIERIANEVGDCLQEDYWTALGIVLDDYLQVDNDGSEDNVNETNDPPLSK